MGFWKGGVSYRELHYNDKNHSLPEGEDVEEFLRGVIEGRMPRTETRNFSPEFYAAELMHKAASKSICLSRVRQYPLEGRNLHLGLWNSENQSEGFFGSAEVQWVAEDQEFTPVDPQSREVLLSPHKAGIFVDASREFVEDAEAIAPVISPKLAFAIGATIDECVINSQGVGRPLGIIHSPATIGVGRQAAGAISYQDVINVYSRVHPAFIADSIWIASPETIPSLLGMVDGSGGYIWVPSAVTSAASAAPTTLLGRPIFWSDKCPGLSSTGCLILADLSMYAYGSRRGIILESSNAPGWYRDRVSFRGIIRCDGKPLLSQPIVPRQGAVTLSAFAMLVE